MSLDDARTIVRREQAAAAAASANASTSSDELAILTARAAIVNFTAGEQNSVHHALYSAVAAPIVEASADAAAAACLPSSHPSPRPVSVLPLPMFTPSTPSRVCVSVRAAGLPSSSWLSEATTLVALFALDDSATHFDTGAIGGAGTRHGDKYTLHAQTEFVRECNAPMYRAQFVLQRPDTLRARRAHAHYLLRVYDVDSEIIDESSYVGLAVFNLEEVLQNCRASSGTAGGEFASISLPLLHPTNSALNEALVSSNATLTISLQVPVEVDAAPKDDAAAPAPLTPAQGVSVGQSAHIYTRLINFLAPNILANNFNLSLTLDPHASLSSSSSSSSPGGVVAPLLSVWYRSRATGLFSFLASLDPAQEADVPTTLVVSDELLAVEAADAGADDAEGGFEIRFLALDRQKLVDAVGLGPEGLEATQAAHKVMAQFLNAAPAAEDNANNAASSPFLGGAAISFKALLAAADSADGLQLTLGAWKDAVNGASGVPERKLQVRVQPRAPLAEVPTTSDDSHTSPAATASPALTVPSLPASVPPAVLAKAHSLLQSGLYFTAYTLSDATAVGCSRNIFLQLVDGAAEGAGLPTRLSWRDATPPAGVDAASTAGHMNLADLEHVYGGKESSEAFQVHLSAAGALPAPECLLTLVSRKGDSLSLEATSWQTRDACIFAILSFQLQVGLPVALWHPSGVANSALHPKIVASERPTVVARPAQLGGSHGSLKPRSPKPPASSSKSGSGGGGDVNLNEVLSKLEKLFEAGRNFIRFTSGAHKPFYVSLFLRKEPASPSTANKPLFWLHWCKADARTVSPTRSMRCDEILGIALGKQSSVFRKEEAAMAPSSHCFSIIGKSSSLHLQSWNERDSDTYAFGIASLVKQYVQTPAGAGTVKAKLWQSGQYSEALDRVDIENGAERVEELDGAQQVDPADIPALANAQGYKCSVELSVKCRNLPSHHNNHIVCVFDRDDETEKLTYLAQTEKQARGVNPEFRKTFKLQFDSRSKRKLRFNVYDLPPSSKSMDDEDRLGSCMLMLAEVVDGAGIEFVYSLTHEAPDKQTALAKQHATIIVQCTSKSEMSLL